MQEQEGRSGRGAGPGARAAAEGRRRPCHRRQFSPFLLLSTPAFCCTLAQKSYFGSEKKCEIEKKSVVQAPIPQEYTRRMKKAKELVVPEIPPLEETLERRRQSSEAVSYHSPFQFRTLAIITVLS